MATNDSFRARLEEETAEVESFQAACDNGLIPGHLGKEDARHVFGLGFRFALGYLFKAHKEDGQ